MKVDISGDWMYMFTGSGTRYYSKEEDFFYVFSRTVRISEITGMEVNYELFTIKLFVKGFDTFVFLNFQENKNNFKPELQKIVTCLGMNPTRFSLQ